MTTPDTPASPELLRSEIERTRADLGGTVQALAAKTDVTTRARQKLNDVAGRTAQATAPARARARDLTQRAAANRHHPAVRRYAPTAALAVAAAAVAVAVRRRAQNRH